MNAAIRLLCRPATVFVVWVLLFAIGFHVVTRGFFGDRVGLDYDYFLPWLLSGYYWFLQNGLEIPWFTPALCAGIPQFANPQSLYYSLPQVLTFITDPITAIRITTWSFALVGFSGMWLLASLITRATSIRLFAALAFGANDMFLWRTYVGHLSFQAYMLLPLACYLLLAEGHRQKQYLNAILAGALLAYFIHGGASVIVVPVGVCILVVLLAMNGGVDVWRRLMVALVAAIMLSLSKLVAAGYFMAQFPRSLYPLPGTDGILASVELTLRSLVAPPSAETISRLVSHRAFVIEPVELNYAIGITPLVAIVLCGLLCLGRVRTLKPDWRWLAIAVMLCLPVALDVYQPTWHALLKSLPYFGNVSSLFRWNLVYLVPAILLAVRLLEAVPWGANRIAPVLALAAIPAAGAYTPDYMQLYSPARIVEAWRRADVQGEIPPITELDEALVEGKRASTVGADDAMVHGASQIVCNEPLFGYRLENFRFDAVSRGSVFEERDGAFNFYRPECFVFPGANSCSKGDRMPVADATRLVRLTEYRSMEFKMPMVQRAALWVSYLGLILLIGVLVARAWLEFESRVRLRQPERLIQ